jgi:hypothetical protein
MSVVTFGGTELRSYTGAAGGLWGSIISGFDEMSEVRGKDVTIPGKSGRLVTNRVADRRQIVLEVWVLPAGSSEALSEANYLSQVQTTLHAIFDPTLAPAELRAYGPYLGIASGHYYSITARHLNTQADPDWQPGLPRKFVVTLESVSSPPDWTYH